MILQNSTAVEVTITNPPHPVFKAGDKLVRLGDGIWVFRYENGSHSISRKEVLVALEEQYKSHLV